MRHLSLRIGPFKARSPLEAQDSSPVQNSPFSKDLWFRKGRPGWMRCARGVAVGTCHYMPLMVTLTCVPSSPSCTSEFYAIVHSRGNEMHLTSCSPASKGRCHGHNSSPWDPTADGLPCAQLGSPPWGLQASQQRSGRPSSGACAVL